MNELLSTNVEVIESEINFFKESAGKSFWEIGRRLNHVKENDLARGEFTSWLEKVGIVPRTARRLMRIAKELNSNETTLSHLGIVTLDLIASLPEEVRDNPQITENGELKEVSDMSVRELEKLKKSLNDSPTEIQLSNADSEKSQSLEAVIEEKVKELDALRRSYDFLEMQYNQVLDQNGEFLKKAEQLDQVKEHLNKNGDQHKEVLYAVNLTDLRRRVGDLLTLMSPIRYQNDLRELDRNGVTYNQYQKLVDRVSEWCNDMQRLLNSPLTIDVEYSEL